MGEEEPEEEQGEEEDSSISEEEEETGDDEPDPWSPLRQKAGEDIEESYLKEVQQFLDKGNPKTMPKMLLLMPYYLQVEEGYGESISDALSKSSVAFFYLQVTGH